jgi:hypothetical protein
MQLNEIHHALAWATLVASAAALCPGCGSVSAAFDHAECMSECQAVNQCPENATSPEHCDTLCSDVAALTSASGCTGVVNALFDCLAKQPSLCGNVNPCDVESAAYDKCTQPYCSAHPSTPGC